VGGANGYLEEWRYVLELYDEMKDVFEQKMKKISFIVFTLYNFWLVTLIPSNLSSIHDHDSGISRD
jgi:hypothetical protein